MARANYDGATRGQSILVTGRRSKQIAAAMKILPEPLAIGIVDRQSRSFRG